jgi:hypothetical protein
MPAGARVPPSEQEIEPYVPMKHPGNEPQRLPPPPKTREHTYWEQFIGNPNVSPELQKRAEKIVERETAAAKVIQEQMESDYRDKRTQYNIDIREYEKEPIRRLEYLQKTLATRALQAVDPTVRDRALADLAKVKLEIAKARRETYAAGGTHFERELDEQGRPIGPAAVVPGLPKPEVKAPTAEQANAIKFAIRVRDDLNEADSKMGYGKALTNLTHHNLAQSAAVLGQGNINSILPQAYKDARDRYKNFGTAFMTNVSGAAYAVKEAEENLLAYIPMPGDDDKRLRDKAVRRNRFVDAVVKAGGEITMEAAKDIGKSTAPDTSSGLKEGQTGTHKGRPVVVRNGEWVLQ